MVSPPEYSDSPTATDPPFKRLLRAMRRRWHESAGFLPQKTERPDTAAQNLPAPDGTDQRRHPRISIKHTPVRVTDGCLSALAEIDNISPNGICLSNLPEQLYASAGRLTVFSSDNPGMPVLQIEPRWQRTGWDGKTIGAMILNVSETWQLFFVHAASRMEA